MTERRIRLLPDDLVARIAAGEVVERPASIVKELVENSLDAGATSLVVALEGAGRTRLLISDNGCGMSLDDAHLAFRRHATSKISALEDLEALTTFGFRGEALPSIASVSRLRVLTRPAGAEHAWEISMEGGRVVEERPAPRETGTTIEVRDVFFNTPARFKFLKSDATERAQCLRTLEEVIFSSPHVSFELRVEDGPASVYPASQAPAIETLRARLAAAWGARWGKSVVPVSATSPHFTVTGLVTTPLAHQASARYQFLYVNRRPVQNRRLARAVYEAFTGQLPSLRHPGWVLFLDVDPSTVDVNVHPSKREVKLTHESELFVFLRNAVREALLPAAPAAPAVTDAAPAPIFFGDRPVLPAFAPAVSARAAEIALDFYRPAAGESAAPAVAPPPVAVLADPDLRVIGQARRMFIVAESAAGLVLIDQHAAAERAAYERLLALAESRSPESQLLLVPFVWETALSLRSRIAGALPELAALGFGIEPFGGDSFVVKALPAGFQKDADVATLLDGVSDVLGEEGESRGTGPGSLRHKLAAMAACKSSVRAGDALTVDACRAVVASLARCAEPQTCPHGRPTVLRFDYADLERRFRRA